MYAHIMFSGLFIQQRHVYLLNEMGKDFPTTKFLSTKNRQSIIRILTCTMSIECYNVVYIKSCTYTTHYIDTPHTYYVNVPSTITPI